MVQEESVFRGLEGLKMSKKEEIESYFKSIRDQVIEQSKNPTTIDATKSFNNSVNELNKNSDILNENNNFLKSLEDYYSSDFKDKYYETVKRNPAEDLIPKSKTGIYLQSKYIVLNPNPLGSKDQLDSYSDDNYSKAHRKFHPYYRSFLKRFGYYDIFLVNNDGDIIYSVFKEIDFATNIKHGKYSETGIVKVFSQAVESNDPNFAVIVDYERYLPSYDAPASFIASPIFDNGKKIGVIIFQMPVDRINDVMTSNRNWDENGYGKSGESYIVAKDKTLRSNSRFLIEDPKNYYKSLEQSNNGSNLSSIKNYQSSILFQKADTEPVKKALAGENSYAIVKDYRDVEVLSSFVKLNIEGLDWVLLVEIDRDEAFSGVNFLLNSFLIIGLVLIVISLLLAFSTGSVIYKSINKFSKMINNISQDLREGKLNSRIDEESVSIDFKEQARGINELVEIIEELISSTSESLNKIASGDLNARIDKDFKGEFARIQRSIDNLLNNIEMYLSDNHDMKLAQDAGDLDAFIDDSKFEGFYKELVIGLNEQVRSVIEINSEFQSIVEEYGNGNFNSEMRRLPGKKASIHEAADRLKVNLTSFSERINELIQYAEEGDLSKKIDSQGFAGDWSIMMASLNRLMETISSPLIESESVLEKMAAGDLTSRMEGKYQGYFNELKTNINKLGDSLNTLIKDFY